MKKLFVHNPVFRLLAPLFSGVVVYLLLLLVNNNVEQLQDSFLGQELYFCIALSYLTQEFARWTLTFFGRSDRFQWKATFGKAALALLVICAIVTGSVFLYYQKIIGFAPSWSELITFNGVYGVVMLIYISLYISHQFLHLTNSVQLNQELEYKSMLKADFDQFQQGINPQLLFESLNTLISTAQQDVGEAEAFIDHMAAVYRYILAKREHELVPIEEEIKVANELVALLNALPYKKANFITEVESGWVVPGTFLSVLQRIIRTTIPNSSALDIQVVQEAAHYVFKYASNEKVDDTLRLADFQSAQSSYALFSDRAWELVDASEKHIQIPVIDYKVNAL
ncbi:MAG: histidine kinase [Saprospiraceae bacterium]|nr:histidine kinase [Saprospiraceae bacterium]